MRESVIDVLFYLFDDILPEQSNKETDLNQMAYWLSEAGFRREDIGRAMDWFYELTKLGDYQMLPTASCAVRVFSSHEQFYIDPQGQDYLRGLLRAGLLDNYLLEKVIERALALEEPLDVLTLRWVAAMVVLNVYGKSEEELSEALQNEFFLSLKERTLH
ncbi:MAG: hypothetical protein CSA10_00085 [Cardiobacteriales bacterium]|nr:MAG: hypothetical protein CSA10_00085 [Cardiobacteriales bacterium]